MSKRTPISPSLAVSYRTPMAVTSVRALRTFSGSMTTYPICPRCHNTMEHEYQSFCDRCGQALDWKGLSKAEVIY